MTAPSLTPDTHVQRALALADHVAQLLDDAERQARDELGAAVRRSMGTALPLREVRAKEDRIATLLVERLRPRLDAVWAELGEIDARLSARERGLVQAAWRAQVLPYFLRVPLVRRSMDKPLGYAGDYGMVRMIYEEPEEAGNALGRALTRYTWGVGPCRAHRQRRAWALEHLQALRGRAGGPLRAVSYACGPEHTLQAWVRQDPATSVRLYDAEPRALDWCAARFAEIGREVGAPLDVRARQVSARELVDGTADLVDAAPADVVLVLGLFDYLTPETVTALVDRLVSLLNPGGRLLCTNLATGNPWRTFMETIGYWQVAHRSVAETVDLTVHGRADLTVVDARLDDSGTNVFVAVERSVGL